MKKDRLPEIISIVAIILFLWFAFTISRPEKDLQGGDIQHAIDSGQY